MCERSEVKYHLYCCHLVEAIDTNFPGYMYIHEGLVEYGS